MNVSVPNNNVKMGDNRQIDVSSVFLVTKPISQDRRGEGNNACKHIYWHRHEIGCCCLES